MFLRDGLLTGSAGLFFSGDFSTLAPPKDCVALVGNEGMKPYMVMMGIHSLIPVLEHGQKESNYHFSTQSVSFRECMFLNWVLEFPRPSIHIEISVEHPVINAK